MARSKRKRSRRANRGRRQSVVRAAARRLQRLADRMERASSNQARRQADYFKAIVDLAEKARRQGRRVVLHQETGSRRISTVDLTRNPAALLPLMMGASDPSQSPGQAGVYIPSARFCRALGCAQVKVINGVVCVLIGCLVGSRYPGGKMCTRLCVGDPGPGPHNGPIDPLDPTNGPGPGNGPL